MTNPGALDLEWVHREWSELTTPDDTTTAEFEQLVREFQLLPEPLEVVSGRGWDQQGNNGHRF